MGNDVVVLVARVGTVSRSVDLVLTRLTHEGAVVVPPFALSNDPSMQDWRVVRRDTDAIIGWVSYGYSGGLQLARATF